MDKAEEKDFPEADEDESGSIVLLDASKREASGRLMETLFKNIQVATAPKLGDVIDGHVLAKKGVYLYIDLGVYGTGVVYGREYYNARDIIKNVSAGDPISGKVVDLENENGYVELSLQEAGQDKMWAAAEEHMKNKTPLNLKVTSANKGGVVILWQGVPGFLPVSQLTAKHYPRVEGGDKMKILNELQKFVGKSLEVTILDIDPKENKLIFSEKNVESEELKEILGRYVLGAEIEGEVTGVVDFGVFIKIEDGLEGLAHISELDWGLVESPGDLFKVGDQVRAKIINIEGGKISLSVKALKPDPWKEFAEKYKKGDIVQGRITKINRFGGFVQVDNTLSGLAHVSEFASEKDMRDALQINSTYHFQILVLNPEEHKLSLSFINPNETKKEESPAEFSPVPEVAAKELEAK